MATNDDGAEARWARQTLPATPRTPGETSPPTVAATPRSGPHPEPGARPSSSPFAPPRVRFEEQAELGRGGMGRVYEAHDRALDRPVAIKQALADDDRALERFEHEVRITARLQHPNIVPILDAGRDAEGRPYYVMRKVEGRPLATLIEEATTLADRIALVPRILAAVDAAAYAHARGIVHRDIKPWNVLCGPFGETLLIDWGIALELATATEPEGAQGTPGFLAPEQARGEALDARADVYALGATLFHALAGTRPLEGCTVTEAFAKAAAGAGVELARLPAELPPELATIVAKATAAAREARYRDAGELAEDLRRFTTGQLVAAHRYTTRELLARWVRRHRIAVTVGTLALVVVAAVGIVAVRRVIDERDRADAARAAEAQRADELLVERADAIADDEPTRAIALLKQLRDGSPAWERALAVIDTARSRGVARGRVAHAGHRIPALRASPDGAWVASAAEDGAVLLHDPALAAPPVRVATLDRPNVLAWLDATTLVAVTAPGAAFAIDTRTRTTTPLPTGGPVYEVVGVRDGTLIVIGHDRVLREVARGGAPHAIGPVDAAARAGAALLYATRDHFVYARDGAAPVVLAPRGTTNVLGFAASHDGTRAAAFGFGAVIEWELGDAPRERGRWAIDAARALYVAHHLLVDDQSRLVGLQPGQPPRASVRATGVGAYVQGETCTYLATVAREQYVVCPDVAWRLGERAELASALALAAGRLVAGTSAGTLLSWDLAELNPRSTRVPARAIVPSAFGAGVVVVRGTSLDAVTLATGEVRTLDDLQVVVRSGPRYALVLGLPGATLGLTDRPGIERVERLELATLARTPIHATALGVTASDDAEHAAVVMPGELVVYDLARPEQPRARIPVREPPELLAVAAGWLVYARGNDVHRVELATGARVQTRVSAPRELAIAPDGRVAILRDDGITFWDGARVVEHALPRPLAVHARSYGFVVRQADALVLFPPEPDRAPRRYTIATGFDPWLAHARPLAVAPGRDAVHVIDLVAGTTRRIAPGATAAALDPSGTQLLVGRLDRATVLTLTTDAATARARLDALTNAVATPGATALDYR